MKQNMCGEDKDSEERGGKEMVEKSGEACVTFIHFQKM